MPINSLPLQPPRMGLQRDWIWRGWQVRYSYIRSPHAEAHALPPILLLHGFGASLTQWQENLLPLSQHRTVYALDLVGFGASEKASAAYNVGFWVDQVYEFWCTFINRPIALIGHSLGALVALTAAAAYPELAENLILITLPASRQEVLPGWLQPTVSRIESWFSSPIVIGPLFRLIARPRVVRSILKLAYVNHSRITEELIEGFLIAGRDRGAARAFSRLSQARTRFDFCLDTRDLLDRVKLPILVLWGEGDRVIPLTWGRQLPDLHPNLRLIEIPEAGHCPYDEASDRVNAEILEWLSANS
ncbi:alpha/beta fold hydrolase [Leptolyngbya sp. ST-U4]|uniref:alpha/beta fold hydrolase n=2 Tax=unclassified Leptolyngbya TaxID=2650499 RepID=UPI0019C88A02|nr:alpha/beta fold hydrolase [Cyanobacteria bacterium FACHB-502]